MPFRNRNRKQEQTNTSPFADLSARDLSSRLILDWKSKELLKKYPSQREDGQTFDDIRDGKFAIDDDDDDDPVLLEGTIFVEPSCIGDAEKTRNDLYLAVRATKSQLPAESNGASWYKFLTDQLDAVTEELTPGGKSNPKQEAKAASKDLKEGWSAAHMRTSDNKWVHLKKMIKRKSPICQ
eukprot:GHVU01196948.1.p2 GENE.GHVU01196948.1~~GHVU01196948.1.p2  ORF type:complete len:181 (-),score=27.64 GHVU01196948.1:374-916(-)